MARCLEKDPLYGALQCEHDDATTHAVHTARLRRSHNTELLGIFLFTWGRLEEEPT